MRSNRTVNEEIETNRNLWQAGKHYRGEPARTRPPEDRGDHSSASGRLYRDGGDRDPDDFRQPICEGRAPNPADRAPVLGTVSYYTSDAADEEDSVDLGGRRIIKKK